MHLLEHAVLDWFPTKFSTIWRVIRQKCDRQSTQNLIRNRLNNTCIFLYYYDDFGGFAFTPSAPRAWGDDNPDILLLKANSIQLQCWNKLTNSPGIQQPVSLSTHATTQFLLGIHFFSSHRNSLFFPEKVSKAGRECVSKIGTAMEQEEVFEVK